MDPVDEALASAIQTGRIESLGDAASRLPTKFVADLATLFTQEADNPSRWMALAMTLGNNGLPYSSAHAFNQTLALVQFCIPESQVLMEWARRDEASSRIAGAVGRYFAAYRCNPEQTEALDKVKSLGQSLVPRIMVGSWDVFGALNEGTDFQRYLDKVKVTARDNDMLRNNFSRDWFFASPVVTKVKGIAVDCSFVVTKAAKPVLFVPCCIRGRNPLKCYEVPIVLFPTDDADPDDLPVAYDLALNYLHSLARYVGAERMDMEEEDSRILTPVSLFTGQRLAKRAGVERRFIDLTVDQSEIWKRIRKGHKHAINWGKKELEIRLWDGVDDKPIAEMLNLYERSGRGAVFSTADEIRDFWTPPRGDLYMVYRHGQPLGAVAVNYDGPNAYYTASVSIDHDDVPTAHWPLYNAILRAKEKGMRNFQFGYLEIDESFEQKQRAIAHFKSGFAPDFTRHIWWYVHVHGSAS
jgi:hypothetical protein